VRVAGSLGVGFGETMYYKGVAEGEDTEGMMILFGPGEMQLFTEKKSHSRFDRLLELSEGGGFFCEGGDLPEVRDSGDALLLFFVTVSCSCFD
jgi:hypothetical protein